MQWEEEKRSALLRSICHANRPAMGKVRNNENKAKEIFARNESSSLGAWI